jgi:ribosomal RNA-processing protein 36
VWHVQVHQKLARNYYKQLSKRTVMPLSTKLERNLRAADDSSDGESYYEVSDRSSPSVVDTGDGADILTGSEDEEEDTGNNV